MKINNRIKFGMFFLLVVIVISFVSGYSRSSAAYSQFTTFDTYGEGDFREDRSLCEPGQDFVIQVAPFGCEPSVVRSDLLEEQNVGVFCQLAATKINPLVDVEAIEHITFGGEYSDMITGIGFHPAKAALGGDRLSDLRYTSGYGVRLNSPLLNNIGYAVIVLKQTRNESSMPDYVEGNLTAKIRYDITNAYGTGKATFYLPELSDPEWEKSFKEYGFWDSRGYLRAEGVDEDSARIIVFADDSYSTNYRGINKRVLTSFRLEKGKTSGLVYLPGFDCLATMQLKLDSVVDPDTTVRFEIDGERYEVQKREKFLDNKCYVSSFQKNGLKQSAKVYCDVDDDDGTLDLKISPKVTLNIGGTQRDYSIEDYLFDDPNGEPVYLGYIGTKDGSSNTEELFVSLVLGSRREQYISNYEKGELIDGPSVKYVDYYDKNKNVF